MSQSIGEIIQFFSQNLLEKRVKFLAEGSLLHRRSLRRNARGGALRDGFVADKAAFVLVNQHGSRDFSCKSAVL